MTIQGYYTVPEAARRLEVPEYRIHKRIQSGELEAKKVGRTWVIPTEEIERLYASKVAVNGNTA